MIPYKARLWAGRPGLLGQPPPELARRRHLPRLDEPSLGQRRREELREFGNGTERVRREDEIVAKNEALSRDDEREIPHEISAVLILDEHEPLVLQGVKAHGRRLRLFVFMVELDGRQVPLFAKSATRTAMEGHRGRNVPTGPAGKFHPPRQIPILLVHEEALVEVFAVDGDALEHRSTSEEGGTVDPGYLLGGIELAGVALPFPTRHEAPTSRDRKTRRIDEVQRAIGVEVVSEDLPRRHADQRVSSEEREHLVDVRGRREQIGVAEEDELSPTRCDASIHGPSESRVESHLDHRDAGTSLPAERRLQPRRDVLERIVVQDDDLGFGCDGTQERGKGLREKLHVPVRGNENAD